MRRQDAQVDDAAVGPVRVDYVGPDAHQSGYLAQRIVEPCRKLHAPLLGTARERKPQQVEHTRIEVFGRSIDRERIAPVRSVDVEPRGQHTFAFDIFRSRLERKLVARGVEKQLQRRAVGDLQAG